MMEDLKEELNKQIYDVSKSNIDIEVGYSKTALQLKNQYENSFNFNDN